MLENDAAYVNLSPYGEPQLGKRGLYPTMGGKSASDAVMAMLWTLAYSDGTTTLLEVADRADLDFAAIRARPSGSRARGCWHAPGIRTRRARTGGYRP